jgi:predicted nucleic acid-binding protein
LAIVVLDTDLRRPACRCRAARITVPANDAWVAACCVTFGYPLLTLDRKHFEPLAVFGLRLL